MTLEAFILHYYTKRDWILENQSKLHIGNFEINGFKAITACQGKQAQVWKYTRDASIYHLSDNLKNFWLLSMFPAK